MNRVILTTLIFSLILTSCDNGSEQIKSSPYESTYQPLPSLPTLLRGATVLTGNGERFENTDLILKEGKIDAIGLNLVAEDIIVIEAQGMWVTPGIIDVHSHLGVYPAPE